VPTVCAPKPPPPNEFPDPPNVLPEVEPNGLDEFVGVVAPNPPPPNGLLDVFDCVLPKSPPVFPDEPNAPPPNVEPPPKVELPPVEPNGELDVLELPNVEPPPNVLLVAPNPLDG